MIDLSHLRRHVIEPTLRDLAVGTPGISQPAAVRLLLGTFLAESLVGTRTALVQISGPALGIYQMEPVTHHWLTDRVRSWPLLNAALSRISSHRQDEQLVYDLRYATAMARLRYWVVPEALPDASDAEGLAAYWKQHYNTHLGAGKPAKFVDLMERHGV